ncbi:EF-hand domain-containing family member C2 [Nephila pilipes]|uniref:EF-hand domain-containing family member C2 n=1 Tax=Nephila pilipes TaxID=299642 RepID=A0A8X6IFW7_NEPPI|nr:EF-hand domain-containing family member C2 [Nephila pilipes]
MRSTRLPLIPGHTNHARRTRRILPRVGAFFQPVDPPGDPTYMKFLNDRNIFKKTNAFVLTFHASFDNRGEPPRDRMKYRNCHVLYFVEDGTIKVYEPKQRNSGTDQGCLVSRNLIPKPDGGFYCLDDLRIGETVIFFGKSFKLLDCDPFTKRFLTEMGYRPNIPESQFVDPVTEDRIQEDMPRTNIRRPTEKSHKGEVFLNNFPNALHFYCIYTRSETQFEEKRYVSLYYHLYDGRIKIIDDEKLRNYQELLRVGGHDSYLLLKPTHIPKTLRNLSVDNIGNGQAILNNSGTTGDTRLPNWVMMNQMQKRSTFLIDANPPKDGNKQDFYGAEDLELGKTIDVFGAKIFLYDCDEFTKQFYKHNYGKEFVPVTLPELKRFKYQKLVYPQEFVKPVDSLISCYKSGPSSGYKSDTNPYDVFCVSPNKGGYSENFLKFLLNCRDGVEGNILRFLCNILTDESPKKHCLFVISFYLQDDTIEITKFDPDLTQGLRSGEKQVYRRKVTKPTTGPLNCNDCLYQKTDFYIGNIICVNTDQYYILNADEYTLEYMEKHSDVFQHSNSQFSMNKFRHFLREKASSLKAAFETVDVSKKGMVSYNDFRFIIRQHLQQEESLSIPEQEIITIARFSCLNEYTGYIFSDLVSRVQAELKKQRFQDFNKLKDQFELLGIQCGNRTGFFSASHVYRVLFSFPLNISKDLLKCFIFKFPKKDDMIDYLKILECLDYIKHPSEEPNNIPYAINLNWKQVETVKNIDKIDYLIFLQNLTRENCPECDF